MASMFSHLRKFSKKNKIPKIQKEMGHILEQVKETKKETGYVYKNHKSSKRRNGSLKERSKGISI